MVNNCINCQHCGLSEKVEPCKTCIAIRTTENPWPKWEEKHGEKMCNVQEVEIKQTQL